jgi:glucose-1-phosphate thymidylyltransferase
MKGIILAGGSGTRLYPLTMSMSKQLLPIYDKPMVYYPLSTLMLSGIRDILIISTPEDLPRFKNMFHSGKEFGLNISYKEQPHPDGLAQAFILGKEFIGNDSVCLILGDNVFFGGGLRKRLINANENAKKGLSTIFGYFVNDPERFGVCEFDKNNKVISVEEKPKNPKSNYAITGLYFFDNNVVKYAEEIKPSRRGELEIIDVIKKYLEHDKISIDILGRGFTWLDTGTHDSLAEATDFVRMMEQKQGIQIACLEEISYINGWMNKDDLLKRAKMMGNSPYGKHLMNVVEDKIVY